MGPAVVRKGWLKDPKAPDTWIQVVLGLALGVAIQQLGMAVIPESVWPTQDLGVHGVIVLGVIVALVATALLRSTRAWQAAFVSVIVGASVWLIVWGLLVDQSFSRLDELNRQRQGTWGEVKSASA
jgi:uncharacterized membrane protein YeaQ/YmgE (transglycosylase-associated protein family)